jgi:endogenous inhibitor of DNA gyrase (YacG/DUF329 family)
MPQPIHCPICHKPAEDSRSLPFCSDRCRKVDFIRWWDGRYAITETAGSGEVDANCEGWDESMDGQTPVREEHIPRF